MSAKREQGWLSSLLDRTDKLILAIGGYGTSSGIPPLGEFDDDEGDTEEDEVVHEPGNVIGRLEDMGSFEDDEEDSAEDSPREVGKKYQDDDRFGPSCEEEVSRKCDSERSADGMEVTTPLRARDSAVPNAPPDGLSRTSGARRRVFRESRSKFENPDKSDIPTQGPTTILGPSVARQANITSLPNMRTNDERGNTSTSSDQAGVCSPCPAHDEALARPAADEEHKLAFSAPTFAASQPNFAQSQRTRTRIAISNTPKNYHGAGGCSPQIDRRVETLVVTPNAGGYRKSTSAYQSPETFSAARGRKKRYSHVSDTAWMKSNADSSTIVKPTSLAERRLQDERPDWQPDRRAILDVARDQSKIESNPDAGSDAGSRRSFPLELQQSAGDRGVRTVDSMVPTSKQPSKIPQYTQRTIVVGASAKAEEGEYTGISLSSPPIVAREGSDEPVLGSASDYDGTQRKESASRQRGREDSLKQIVEDYFDEGKNLSGYVQEHHADDQIGELEVKEGASTTVGFKRASGDNGTAQENEWEISSEGFPEPFAPSKRGRTGRQYRLGVMRHSSRLDDVLQERNRKLATMAELNDGEAELMAREGLQNGDGNYVEIPPWPDQDLRPYDTPIVDFSLPALQALALAQLGFDTDTVIICSPFRRCLQTAGVVARTLGVKNVSVWLEMGERMDKVRNEIAEMRKEQRQPEFSYLGQAEMVDALGEGVRLESVAGKQPPGHESGVEAKQRFITTIARLRDEYLKESPVLVIAHGDTLDAAGESLASQIIYEASYCAWAVFDLDGHRGLLTESYGIQMIPL